ncbi:hypothetical protein Q31b_21250 [Novipirellula aureliae]|uniref:DUF2752 domain-containing protein n=1 Tax=Novipirellula aureliae TaxID=2527966 RepID=A0A5C6E2J7_9BACT|nr:DUF2752 domain-containing protein [Novipirellula aureliae]TWU43088.1 hypothetical protein Q31b_21250 [Novipirellula aureliae]
MNPLWKIILRWLAYWSAAAYIAWNAWWLLVQNQLPQSMFYAATGLPCPTTGCTRSLIAFGRGDLATSFRMNPFSLLIFGFAVLTALHLIANRLRAPNRFAIPALYVPAWLGLLGVAEVYQLCFFAP